MSNGDEPEDRTLSRMPSADDAGQTLSRPGNLESEQTLSRPGNVQSDQTLSRPGLDAGSDRTLSRPAEDGGRTLSRPAQSAAAPPPVIRKRGPVQIDKPIWEVGDLIDGKYDVTGVIGRGGMGVVFKVLHREWN